MALLELYLQINPSGWKLMRYRDQEPGFELIRSKVLYRDANSCQFCGFSGLPSQLYIVALDGNYNNNSYTNLCSACSICTRCVLLGSFETVDEHDSVERLIICNELTQIQLNHLYRLLLTLMSDSSLRQCEIAKTVFRGLRNRAQLVDEMFGTNSSDTRVFMQSVLDSGVSEHKNLRDILQNLRYFPTRHSFSKEWPLWKTQLKERMNEDIKIEL